MSLIETRHAADLLADQLEARVAHVAVLGLGHAGWPVAVALTRSGYRVTGLEVDPIKVRRVNEGISPLADAIDDDVRALIEGRRLRASHDFAVLGEVDCALIGVP